MLSWRRWWSQARTPCMWTRSARRSWWTCPRRGPAWPPPLWWSSDCSPQSRRRWQSNTIRGTIIVCTVRSVSLFVCHNFILSKSAWGRRLSNTKRNKSPTGLRLCTLFHHLVLSIIIIIPRWCWTPPSCTLSGPPPTICPCWWGSSMIHPRRSSSLLLWRDYKPNSYESEKNMNKNRYDIYDVIFLFQLVWSDNSCKCIVGCESSPISCNVWC